MADHRFSPRERATDGLVDVYRISKLGNRQRLGSCLLVDVSRTGLGVHTDFSVENGEVLFFQSRTLEKYAVVRYCRAEMRGYRVGLRLCAAPARDKEASGGGGTPRPSPFRF
jgi:hypothetical protein